MALIRCDECGNSVSSKAVACPHCGAPIADDQGLVPDFNEVPTRQPKKDKPKGVSRRWGCFLFFFIPIVSVVVFTELLDRGIGRRNDVDPPEKKDKQQAEIDSKPFVTKAGYLAATSEELLEKAVQYQKDRDPEALAKLMRTRQVFTLKEGLQIEIVKFNVFSHGKLKFRARGQIDEYWTVMQAIDGLE